jgi:hypothetical protein
MFKSGYFISIGAGKNQLPLILKSKELGLKIIAVDQNRDAIGFQVFRNQNYSIFARFSKDICGDSKTISAGADCWSWCSLLRKSGFNRRIFS